MTSRSRVVRLAVAASVVVGCSGGSGGSGRLNDVVACATISLQAVPGFIVTQDWYHKVARNGAAADNPAIRAAAQRFQVAATDNDQAAVDAATATMEAACRTLHLGGQGDATPGGPSGSTG